LYIDDGLFVYIDDGLFVGPSKDRVIRRYKFALDAFDKAGLMVLFEKSTIPDDASTSIEFIGVLIDTEQMCVFAAPHKIASLRAIVAKIVRSRGSVKVRRLASVVGKLNLLEVAFGPAVLVGTRIVSIQVSEAAEQFGWERGFVVLSEDTRAALRRVSVSLDLWNRHPMRTLESEIALTLVLAFEDPAGTARKIPNRCDLEDSAVL
jgi:hypothetical protein